mmetsp:Transcript_12894/g.37839  ORF Transcript_12894/g.37839 Transcript_12894/m.37839 type:complete len:199 (-) Transcript_12894:168-764(-)
MTNPTPAANPRDGASVGFSAVVTPPPEEKFPSASRPKAEDGDASASGAECHLLPCAVHYDGVAPVHVYFRPTKLSAALASSAKNEGAENDTISADDNADGPMKAAQFRGRGLIAPPPVSLPGDVVGSVLSIPDHGGGKEVEWLGGTFCSVHEWRHEHDAGAVKREVRSGGSGNKGDVVERALNWIEISRVVHEPVVIP